MRTRKHWGWGYLDEQLSRADIRQSAELIAAHLGFGNPEPADPLPLGKIAVTRPRVAPPPELNAFSAADSETRITHSRGKSYTDVVAGFHGQFPDLTDFVLYPRNEYEIEAALAWCANQKVALIPYGGGSSVVGGITPRIPDGYNGAVTLDMREMDRVLEVDPTSRAALIQAGALGPHLEAQLAPHNLTLRFYLQAFQFSTLGGWIATRAGGHFATGSTHIDDHIESIRAITPTGTWESRRLPASGAGVSPDRMLLGSEGTLGVITSAWVRLSERPTARASVSIRFSSFSAGVAAIRKIVQSELRPANCRLIDKAETSLTGTGDGSFALLVLGFESASHDVDAAQSAAIALCEQHGGTVSEAADARSGDVGAWRDAFIRAPYQRDILVAMGVIAETFETAVTWDCFEQFHRRVIAAAKSAVEEVCGQPGLVTCRITHVYPDGCAPYFTVVAPARPGEEVEQWAAIKRAVSQTLINEGGTITHHHAVGRDHRDWYDQQRPDVFASALRGAKSAVDPHFVLNPGVLLDPR